ncbi:MAG: DUF1707 domain-containing protein [Solirubrobacteraceae bacterium]
MSEEQFPSRSRPPARDPTLRVSDADRERLIAELNEHTVDGRLSTEDLEQRVQAAYAARTTGELDALRRDLPVTPRQAALDQRARRSRLTRRMVQETGGAAAAFVVCTAIWLAAGASAPFWPVWVLIVVAITVVRSGWALYGPGADLDAFEADLEARREHRRNRESRRSRERRR